MRVAFPVFSGRLWTAGLSYQRNLLEALQRYAPDIEVYMLGDKNSEAAKKHSKYPVISYPRWSDNILIWTINRIIRRLCGRDPVLEMGLRSAGGSGIQVIFSYGFQQYLVSREIAILFWIPDFQHMHLPEMFSADEVRMRDMAFKGGSKGANLVLLSSQDALRDFHRFSRNYAHKARVVNFVTYIPSRVFKADPATVVSQYRLPQKFIFFPSQFWKHKNHELVFEALKLLKKRGIRPFIVCTGITSDHRNPQYFAQLLYRISSCGLRDQIALLGLVPYEHVFLLIRQSVAVVNASLFEGWSTTVEEAKSVGKRVVLSDIAVHREQNAPCATYFDRHNKEDLADRLAEIWANASPGPDLKLEERAQRELPSRMKGYADAFETVAREAVAIAKGL